MHFWTTRSSRRTPKFGSSTDAAEALARSGSQAATPKSLGAQLPAGRDEPRRDGRCVAGCDPNRPSQSRCDVVGQPACGSAAPVRRRGKSGPPAHSLRSGRGSGFHRAGERSFGCRASEGQWRNGAASARTACGPNSFALTALTGRRGPACRLRRPVRVSSTHRVGTTLVRGAVRPGRSVSSKTAPQAERSAPPPFRH